MRVLSGAVENGQRDNRALLAFDLLLDQLDRVRVAECREVLWVPEELLRLRHSSFKVVSQGTEGNLALCELVNLIVLVRVDDRELENASGDQKHKDCDQETIGLPLASADVLRSRQGQ
jgi:hypothetical protein